MWFVSYCFMEWTMFYYIYRWLISLWVLILNSWEVPILGCFQVFQSWSWTPTWKENQSCQIWPWWWILRKIWWIRRTTFKTFCAFSKWVSNCSAMWLFYWILTLNNLIWWFNLSFRRNFLSRICKQIDFKVSHIFREENHCTDKLASLGLENKLEFKWYDFLPDVLKLDFCIFIKYINSPLFYFFQLGWEIFVMTLA